MTGMAFCKLENFKISGIATAVPKRNLDNVSFGPAESMDERRRFVRNIGVENRRFAEPWQTFSDFALEAAKTLIEELDWDTQDIDALVVVTQSPDYRLPATAIILQDRLGLKTSTVAFDVNLGCSAYPYGLHLLGSMISKGGIEKALLLVGDKSASYNDLLFSDAATATALEYSELASPAFFDMHSDGKGYEAIILKVGGAREPFEAHHFIPNPGSTPNARTYPHELHMDGPAVLNFSIGTVPGAVTEALDKSNLSIDDPDFFIFHQANHMINNTIKKKLLLPDHKVPMSLREFGNTSGATIPVTINANLRDELSNGSHQLLMCGFGVGLSWATAIIEVDNLVIPEIVEI